MATAKKKVPTTISIDAHKLYDIYKVVEQIFDIEDKARCSADWFRRHYMHIVTDPMNVEDLNELKKAIDEYDKTGDRNYLRRGEFTPTDE